MMPYKVYTGRLWVASAVLSILFSLVGAPSFAQDCKGTLVGRLELSEGGEPIAFANVLIRELGEKVLSDEKGFFSFSGVCLGKVYLVEVHYLSQQQSFEVQAAEQPVLLQVGLSNLLKEVLVAEKAAPHVHTEAICTVDQLDFDSRQSVSLGEVVRQLPGVSVLQTGANISKPVIQGLHSNRIVIVNNNLVLEGQQWGREHAPEIDPFSADKVTVVKGAMGVRYGVGAMAGAIVLEPAPLRSEPGWGGWATIGGFSNGRSMVTALALDYRSPKSPWAFRVRSTAKKGGNLRAPDYWLYNTGHSELNFGFQAEWKPSADTRHELSFSRFGQQLGVLRASHLGNLQQIELAAQLDTPLNNINRFSWGLDRPYQGIQHYTAAYKLQHRISDHWKLMAQYGYQFNYRQEYDVVRKTGAAADRAQVAFRLWTNALDVWLEHRPGRYWQGEGGVQVIHFLNYVNRGAFIPNYQTFGASVWAQERWRKHGVPWEWELGGRYDVRRSQVYTVGNTTRDLNQEVVFGSISGVGGVHYHLHPATTLTLHTGYAWRPPSIYELFARGVHHGAGTYEEGDSTLVPEKAWNSNLSWTFRPAPESPWQLTATLFYNQIRDFIYLNPSLTGKVTIRGTFPAYYYRQSDALLRGLDFQLQTPLWAGWGTETRVSLLRADRRVEGGLTPLPLMPANRFQYGLTWQNGTRWQLRALANTVLEQQRVPAEGLIKEAPPGFTTFSLDGSYRLERAGRSWEFGWTAQNLGNLRYREYLNFFRFYADEPGFNLGLRVKCIF